MFIEEVGVKAFPLLGIKHEATDEVIKRDNGESGGNENGFGLREKLEAGLGIWFGLSAGEEGIVGGIGPAGPVIAPTGDEAIEKGVGIIVIADPAGAGEIEIKFVEGAEVGGPFLVAQFDFDPEDTTPLGLNLNGDLLVEFGFIIKEGDAGEAAALGKAGKFEEALGGGGIGGKAGGGMIIGDAAGGERLGDGLVPAGNFIDEGFFIESEGEGAAHADILEGRAGNIKAVKVGGKKGAGMKIGSAPKKREHEGRDESFIEEEICLAGGVEIKSGAGAGNGEGINAGQADPSGAMVEGIFFERDAIVYFPSEEAVGAIADPGGGLGPTIAVLSDGGGVNGEVGGEGGERGKVGEGMGELDLESEGVGSF